MEARKELFLRLLHFFSRLRVRPGSRLLLQFPGRYPLFQVAREAR